MAHKTASEITVIIKPKRFFLLIFLQYLGGSITFERSGRTSL